MDEVEFKQVYDLAFRTADTVDDPVVKRSMMLMLQLINDLNERVTELQFAEEVDEDEDE